MPVEFTLKFAIVEAARERLHEAPFRPFVVKLHDGGKLRITHPDLLTVTKGGRVIFDDGRVFRILNPALIASIEDRYSKK
jgi:hypothetical protein